jgi:RecJ-like exonuclease
MKKKGNKKGKTFQRKPIKVVKPAKDLLIEDISFDKVGDRVSLKGIIDSISQTSGPTLFSLTDGSATLVLKGFEAPGERAHPEINEGDAIEAIVQVNEFNGSLEGEIKKITRLTGKGYDDTKKLIEQTERKKSKALDVEFLIKSPILDKLKDRFIKAATEIRLAILQNRPIIVRHHNDADGYSSGFALERAIIPLIERQHGPGKAAWEYFARAPCQAPFYEIDDSIRDTSASLRNVAKFSNKMPLIVIADNGSTEQDLIGIQQGKVHGSDFIVVDHHQFEEDVISKEVIVHINPFLVGESGDCFSAGMLCTELARFISEVENITQIPGMAGLADRIDIKNPEAVEAYVKIAEKEGYSRKLLNDIATVIDFVSAKLRFMEAREYIEVVFGQPREKQKSLVQLMAPYIRDLESTGLKIAKAAAIKENLGKTTLQILFVEEAMPGFGFYPKPGKTVGLLHDNLQDEKKITNLVTVGVLGSAITMRATDEANFSVHGLIDFLNKKLPDAFTNGGGHKNAGAISFIPGKQKEVLKLLKEFISSNQV